MSSMPPWGSIYQDLCTSFKTSGLACSLNNLMEAMAPDCNSHRLSYSPTLVSVQFLGFLSVIEYEA